MTADEYIGQRVNQFADWYDKKAVSAKSAYLRLKTASVVGALIVPISANVSFAAYDAYRTGVITVLSLLVSISVALDGVYHFGDQWKNYRSTEQFLSREKFLFQTGEGPYRNMSPEDAFLLFVERCEGQIASENSATLNVIISANQPTSNPPEGRI
ncbi:hypothetical protein UB31_08595 [Bradyrhizobium sp. LTSP849]|nr:hypothetical protein UB31_08595 [Bradyrhizobium sp. LTSP849]